MQSGRLAQTSSETFYVAEFRGLMHSVSKEGVLVGVAVIGLPLRSFTRCVVASINVSGLAGTHTREVTADLVDAPQSGACRLSRQVGYPSQ